MPGPRFEGFEPVQRVLTSVAGRLLAGGPLTPDKLHFAWTAAVGPTLARAASVELHDDGRLHVVTSDPRWRREFQRAAPLLRSRLNDLLGAGVVRAIVVNDGSRTGGARPSLPDRR